MSEKCMTLLGEETVYLLLKLWMQRGSVGCIWWLNLWVVQVLDTACWLGVWIVTEEGSAVCIWPWVTHNCPSLDTVWSCCGVKEFEHKVDSSPQSSLEVMNAYALFLRLWSIVRRRYGKQRNRWKMQVTEFMLRKDLEAKGGDLLSQKQNIFFWEFQTVVNHTD